MYDHHAVSRQEIKSEMAEEQYSEHGNVLIVEDEFAVALDLKHTLEERGYRVVGPVGTVGRAVSMIQSEAHSLSAALLDINLQGERVYPAADALLAHGIPFAFLTGYSAQMLPDI